MKTNKRYEVCHECEQAFIDEMNRIAASVDGYATRRLIIRSRELHEAFTARLGEQTKKRTDI